MEAREFSVQFWEREWVWEREWERAGQVANDKVLIFDVDAKRDKTFVTGVPTNFETIVSHKTTSSTSPQTPLPQTPSTTVQVMTIERRVARRKAVRKFAVRTSVLPAMEKKKSILYCYVSLVAADTWRQKCSPKDIFFVFLNTGQSRPLFVYFRSFNFTIQLQIEKEYMLWLRFEPGGFELGSSEKKADHLTTTTSQISKISTLTRSFEILL